MKKVVLFCLASLVLSFSIGAPLRAQQPVEQIKTEYDAQNNLTRITLNPIILISRKHEELRLGGITAYPGQTKVAAKEVALVFVSLSKTDLNKYELAHKLTISGDGERMFAGDTKRTKQVQNGVFLETLAALVPTEVLSRISSAKAVTVKLGVTEVALSPAQISVLGEFARRIQ